MMTFYEHAGTRLRKARIAAGFKTAKTFCEKYGIPTSTYSLHETNKRCLKPKLAEKYAKILRINVAWLLTGLGSCRPPNSDAIPQLSAEEIKSLLETEQDHQPITQLIEDKFSFNSKKVNLLLYTKIVFRIVRMLDELNLHWDMYHLSQQASLIYKDIVESSSDAEAQLNMVTLSIKSLKRNTQTKLNHL